MAKRSRKYGRQIPRNGREQSEVREHQMSDNEITLVQPERGALPVPMNEPWDDNEVAEVAETVRSVPNLPGGYFDFVQQYSTSVPAKPFMLTRPSPPPPELKKAAPKQPSSPPPPPEPRPRAQRTTDIPPPPPPFSPAPSFTPPPPPPVMHTPLRAPVAANAIPVQTVPSSLPPPVLIERRRITDRRQTANNGRAWASMFTVGPLSALVAALVSSLVWSYHAGQQKSAGIEGEDKAGTTETASATVAPCTTTRSGSGTGTGESVVDKSVSAPMALATVMQAPAGETPRISVDALPTVEAGRSSKSAFAPAPVSAPEPAPRMRASRGRAAATRPVDLTTSAHESSRAAASEPAEPAAPAAPPAKELPKEPDRAAITKAMQRASSAAASCGTGPQDGRVSLTIAPSGAVSSVSLVKGFGDAEVNACVLRAFSRAKVPAYEGDPVQVKKAVRW